MPSKFSSVSVASSAIATEPNDLTLINIYQPYSLKDFVNPKTNRPVTPFQLKVYQICAQALNLKGKISTYGAIAKFLNSSPRAVGQALKVNPFAPLPVPCHRVVAANFSIGGYHGQWLEGEKIDMKRTLLLQERGETTTALSSFDYDEALLEYFKSNLFQDFNLMISS